MNSTKSIEDEIENITKQEERLLYSFLAQIGEPKPTQSNDENDDYDEPIIEPKRRFTWDNPECEHGKRYMDCPICAGGMTEGELRGELPKEDEYLHNEPMTYAERYRGIEHAYNESNSETPKFIEYDDPFSTYRYQGKEYVYNPEYGSWLDVQSDSLVTDESLRKILQSALQKSYHGPDDEFGGMPLREENQNLNDKDYTCKYCYGSGIRGRNTCAFCNGTGINKSEEDKPSRAPAFSNDYDEPMPDIATVKKPTVGPSKGRIEVDMDEFEPSHRSKPIEVDMPEKVSDLAPELEPPVSIGKGHTARTPKESAFQFARAVVDALNRRKFTKPYFFQNASPEDFEIFVRDTILEALYNVPDEDNLPHVNDYIIEYDKERTMLGFEFDTTLGEVFMALKAPGQGDTWQIVEFSFADGVKKPIPEPIPEIEAE